MQDDGPPPSDGFSKAFEAWAQSEAWHKEPSYNFAVAHPNFRVVVVTKFTVEDYKDFLGEEFDMSKMQPIKVFAENP